MTRICSDRPDNVNSQMTSPVDIVSGIRRILPDKHQSESNGSRRKECERCQVLQQKVNTKYTSKNWTVKSRVLLYRGKNKGRECYGKSYCCTSPQREANCASSGYITSIQIKSHEITDDIIRGPDSYTQIEISICATNSQVPQTAHL